MTGETFAAYLSHSWRPRDVDLNVEVWSQISGTCRLLVDLPEASTSNPPYYVNRIEELLRRSDVFVCVLAARDAAPEPAAPPGSDGALRCSPYSLFEIRLAERFSRPWLVLYERSTQFRPPPDARDGEVYLAFDRAAGRELPEVDQLEHVIRPRVQAWLAWVVNHQRPQSYQPQMSALVVWPDDRPGAAEAKAVLEEPLVAAGYAPLVLDASRTSNTRAFRLLASAGLVITDVGPTADLASLQVVAAAHARGIPAIRTCRRPAGPMPLDELPWLLRDHPGGYQQDIVVWSDPAELAGLVAPRAAAMFKVARSLDTAEATRHFRSKRYAAYSVFVSHSLKPPHRQLVEEIFKQLDQQQVKCFEYQAVNRSGIDWRKELDTQLAAATHFVALLGPAYEMSDACTYEIETVLGRGDAVSILPYLLEGRSAPHVKLRQVHHPLLHGEPSRNAEIVVDRVMKMLKEAVGR